MSVMEFQYLYQKPSLSSALTQAVGAASMCWRETDMAGQFNVEQALEIAGSTTAEVRHIISFQLSTLMDTSGAATEWNEAIETAIRMVEEMP